MHDIIHIATYVVAQGGGMSMTEKMKMLDEATPADIERLQGELGEGYTVGADEDGRVWVRKNMRGLIREALNQNGVTISSLSARLGKQLQNTSAYLLGKCGTTNDTLEEILFLLDEER